MKKVSIQDLENGMIIGKSIKDGTGKTIAPEGTELNGKLISNLFAEGITEAIIMTEEDQHHMPDEIYKKFGVKNDKELENKIRIEVKERFGDSIKNDPIMFKIMRLVQKFELQKIGLKTK